MNFGENLRLLRKNSKMSQEALAEKIGVSRQSVSKWEVGTAYPEMSNITALCSIFHCNINDLINDNIIDIDSFDKATKEDIVKFKENQQKNMKMISKAIYIISRICEIIIGVPTICLMLACIVFLVISHTFSVEEDKIIILNNEIPYSIENNVLKIEGSEHYISTSTDVKEFVQNHGNMFYTISIEYLLICITVISDLSVLVLHFLYKLYKNVYELDTPFTIENERIINKVVILLLSQIAFSKITALLYSIVASVDLAIEFNVRDIILILVAVSVVYIFKYGRMLQADSKSKIYGEIDK